MKWILPLSALAALLTACDEGPTESGPPSAPTGAVVTMVERGAEVLRIVPFALGEDGAVVGELHLPNGGTTRTQAFVWRAGSGVRRLESSGRTFSGARDVNARGEVVGYVSINGATREAALWTAAGEHRTFRLPATSSSGASEAYSINERGAVTLWRSGAPRGEAFIWSASGDPQPITFPDSVTFLQPADINERGQVAGFYTAPPRASTAFVWTPEAGFRSLGRIGGTASTGRAINNRGMVAGEGITGSNLRRAFVWTAELGRRELEVLTQAYHAIATDVNDHGTVVGYQFAGPRHVPLHRAFVWNEAWGPPIDLGALAGLADQSLQAVAINNDHQVLVTVVDYADEAGTRRTAALIQLELDD